MSRHANNGIGDSKILQRKIPSTGKYRDIKPRVDTGSSMTRYMKHIEDLQTNYRFKNNELFKRMKSTTLAQLVLQVANISMQDDISVSDLPSARSSVITLNGGDTQRDGGKSPDDVTIKNGLHYDDDDDELITPRSSLQSVIKGMGEVDMIGRNKPQAERCDTPDLEKPYTDCPYLILDVRDSDEYNACHITGAKNYPIAMLSRTMNNFTREILDYRNCPGRILILYDEDERISTVAATTMVERGFDNIFILSGGLKVLGQKIPDGIVNGTLPASCRMPSTSRRSKNNQSHSYLGPPADHRKKRFSAEDLDKINHYMEESLIPQDTGSRLSRLTNNSRHSNAASKADTGSTFVGPRRAWR